MPSVRCPACDGQMEIEPDWYGRKVACPDCGERFVVRRPGEEEEAETAKPRRRRAWEDDENEPPRKKKKRKPDERPMPMGRGTKQLILVAAIVGPILLMCLGCFGWGAFVIYAPVNYPDPWVTQSLPDGSFAVQFPKKPDTPDLPFADFAEFNRGGSRYEYTEDPPKDAVFEFGSIEDGPPTLDDALRAESPALRLTTGGKRTREATTTVLGRACKEVEFSAGGGKVVYRLVDVSAGGRRRYVYLLAGGRNVSEADRNKFLNSLQPGR